MAQLTSGDLLVTCNYQDDFLRKLADRVHQHTQHQLLLQHSTGSSSSWLEADLEE